MGLDMWLAGFESSDSLDTLIKQAKSGTNDDWHEIDLGYWRKVPDLHGYIVKTYNNGVDDCKHIFLNTEQLTDIQTAAKTNQLPTTTGFFFGESKNDDVEIASIVMQIQKAVDYLKKENRYVYYLASW